MKNRVTQLCLLLVIISSSCFGQQVEIKDFYAKLNLIQKDFATSKDTTLYFKQSFSLLKDQSSFYVNLIGVNDLLKNSPKNRKSKKIIKYALKNNLSLYTRVKFDMRLPKVISKFAATDKNKRYLRRQINRKQSLSVFENFNLYKTVSANAFYYPDQLGRKLSELPLDYTSDVIRFTDSSNLVNLYETIEEEGFPDIKNIGEFGYFILLLHTFSRPCDLEFKMPNDQNWYDYLDSTLLVNTLNGNFRNDEYAYFVDNGYTYYRCPQKGQKYGTLIEDGRLQFPLYDVTRVDENRAEIYLPPLWVDAALKGFALPDGYNKP